MHGDCEGERDGIRVTGQNWSSRERECSPRKVPSLKVPSTMTSSDEGVRRKDFRVSLKLLALNLTRKSIY